MTASPHAQSRDTSKSTTGAQKAYGGEDRGASRDRRVAGGTRKPERGARALCPYASHRPYDWRPLGGAKWICGVCHPPACPECELERWLDDADERDFMAALLKAFPGSVLL